MHAVDPVPLLWRVDRLANEEIGKVHAADYGVANSFEIGNSNLAVDVASRLGE
jgi:hypothetical protein